MLVPNRAAFRAMVWVANGKTDTTPKIIVDGTLIIGRPEDS